MLISAVTEQKSPLAWAVLPESHNLILIKDKCRLARQA